MSSQVPSRIVGTAAHPPRPALSYAVLLGSQVAVGSAAILARFGTDAGMSATALAAWRLSLASAALVLLLQLRRLRTGTKPSDPLGHSIQTRLVAAGVCLGLHFVTWFASLEYTSVTRSTLMVATSPLFAGLGGVLLLRHRLRAGFWVGLALAGVGVYLVTLGPAGTSVQARSAGASTAPLGDALAIAGAAFVAAYLLLVQDLQARLGTVRVISWTYTSAAVSLCPLVPLVAGVRGAVPMSSAAWVSVLGMAAIPQLLGHTSLNWSLKYFTAGVVGVSTLLEPGIAAALAWPIFGEPVTAVQVFGGAVVLAGVWLAMRA